MNRFIKSALVAAALVALTAAQSNAQDLGVGLSLLGDEGGIGIAVDYAKLKAAGEQSKGLVYDASFNHNNVGGFGVDVSFNTILLSVGYRVQGKAGEKATWHVQGTGGIGRRSGSAAGAAGNLCNLANVDCSASSTSLLIMPGGGLIYWMSETGGVGAQLDIPIFLGDDGGNTTRFVIKYVKKMGS